MRRIEGPRDLPHLRRRLLDQYDPGSYTPDLQRILPVNQLDPLYRGIRDAELFWVTRDMTTIALDGSHDLPDWTPATARPSPTGLLIWQGALPTVRWRPIEGLNRRAERVPLPLRGICWVPTTDEAMTVLLLTDAITQVRGTRADAEHPMVAFDSLHLNLHSSPDMAIVDRTPLPEAGPILALVGATWIMMQQPQIADRAAVRPAQRDHRAAENAGHATPTITLVDLRTLRHQADDSPPTSQRRLGVRHIVRGHWRQHFHSSDNSHRPRFIAPYIRGPRDAPLAETERVQVWRR